MGAIYAKQLEQVQRTLKDTVVDDKHNQGKDTKAINITVGCKAFVKKNKKNCWMQSRR